MRVRTVRRTQVSYLPAGNFQGGARISEDQIKSAAPISLAAKLPIGLP